MSSLTEVFDHLMENFEEPKRPKGRRVVVAVDRNGEVRTDALPEQVDLSRVGRSQPPVRASHIDPDGRGGWVADLSPVDGPVLGAFDTYEAATLAEQAWLAARGMPAPKAGRRLFVTDEELPFLKDVIELGINFRIGLLEPHEVESVNRLRALRNRLTR